MTGHPCFRTASPRQRCYHDFWVFEAVWQWFGENLSPWARRVQHVDDSATDLSKDDSGGIQRRESEKFPTAG